MARTKRTTSTGRTRRTLLHHNTETYINGRKAAPIQAGICVCLDDETLLGTGDCYLCEPIKKAKTALDNATEFSQTQEQDGSIKNVETIDVDKLPDKLGPSRIGPVEGQQRFSLKLRRKRGDAEEDNGRDVLQNTNSAIYSTLE